MTVIPAKAGIQLIEKPVRSTDKTNGIFIKALDTGLRRYDDNQKVS